MKHIQKKVFFNSKNSIIEEFFTDDSIFFDIETTGFSPTSSNIYLIGSLYRYENKLVTEQFLAESKDDEKELLEQFMNLLSKFHCIISFNGVGFDIPFIKAKCNTLGIHENLKEFSYIDIFKIINNIKFLLKLPNYKQTTIEKFLGIHRKDQFTGGELINIYENYLQTKSADMEEQLLLHNFEDITGMLDLMPILSYQQILNGSFSVETVELSSFTSYEGEIKQEMIITLKNDYFIPKRVSYQHKDFYLTINKDVSKLRVPIFDGELKYFYSNYKDYFYLPQEDIAIHKSVATFVDKQYRERAKASNCYTRKKSTFLPQYDAIMNPSFKSDFKDKVLYFELTDDFLSSDVMLRRYVNHIFTNATKNK